MARGVFFKYGNGIAIVPGHSVNGIYRSIVVVPVIARNNGIHFFCCTFSLLLATGDSH